MSTADSWRDWLTGMDDAAAVFTASIAGMPGGPFTQDTAVAVETAALELFSSPGALDDPAMAQIVDGFHRYIGCLFVTRFGGTWRDGGALGPVVRCPFRRLIIPSSVLRFMVFERERLYLYYIFDQTRRQHEAWQADPVHVRARTIWPEPAQLRKLGGDPATTAALACEDPGPWEAHVQWVLYLPQARPADQQRPEWTSWQDSHDGDVAAARAWTGLSPGTDGLAAIDAIEQATLTAFADVRALWDDPDRCRQLTRLTGDIIATAFGGAWRYVGTIYRYDLRPAIEFPFRQRCLDPEQLLCRLTDKRGPELTIAYEMLAAEHGHWESSGRPPVDAWDHW